MRSLLQSIFICFVALWLASCGGGPAERIKERAAITPEPSPTPGERDISGSFLIAGSGANEMDPYTGSLSVTPKGDNYEFRWATTKGTRIGTGVQMGSSTAATFATTGGGKGCGVALYHIDSDGTLVGLTARWGDEIHGQERAFHSEGKNFVGTYLVAGLQADGKSYTNGSLEITKDGSGYDFEWTINGERRVGFGVWKGSYAAVSFGGPQCSFALYDIQSNGSLNGEWGGQKSVTFGKETAKRQ